MSHFLTLDGVSASAPDGSPLFSDLTLSVGSQRIGLVGRNGAGKSTLFDLIAGRRSPLTGHVRLNGTCGELEQLPGSGGRIVDLLGVGEDVDRLRRLEAGHGTLEDAERADWLLEERIERVFADLGLGSFPLETPVSILSGGERTRVALARVWLQAPDLLLLDEPTNNLDAEGRQLIGGLLDHWPGGVIVASHDRDLLEHMDRIVHLSTTGVMVFSGGWSDFADARDAELARSQAELERASRELSQTERGVQKQAERAARRAREGRAERASRSQSKLFLDAQKERSENTQSRDAGLKKRQLDAARSSVENARRRIEILTPVKIELPDVALPSSRLLVQAENISLSVGDRTLFRDIGLRIEGPQRWALRGRNGSGKSSFLKLVTGEWKPTTGTFSRAEVPMAMLDQHVSLLPRGETLLSAMLHHNPGMTEHEAHAALARFAFRNSDALRLPETMSGGERMRAGLAMVMSGPNPPQLLILDEPTNHLDIDTIETLEAALASFSGALLVVSHDERFLEAIGCDHVLSLG